MELCLPEIMLALLREINHDNPATILRHIVPPFLVIEVITAVEIEDVFPDQDELANTFPDHGINDFAFEGHDIILDGIVPFPYQFNNGIIQVIIRKQQFHVEGPGAKLIPLWMDVVVVNRLAEFKFTVFPAVER